MFLAKALDCPELVLANEEVEALAIATQKVTEQYSTNLNPKALAWIQLAMVAGGIYGTRLFAIRARQQAAAASGGSAKPARNVVDIKKSPSPTASGGQGSGDSPGGGDARTPADLFGLNYSAAIPAEV